MNRLTSSNLQGLLGNMLRVLMGLLGSLALAMIMFGGVMFMTSTGNAEKQKKGMEILVWAGLGVIVIFTSYALVDLVFDVFR